MLPDSTELCFGHCVPANTEFCWFVEGLSASGSTLNCVFSVQPNLINDFYLFPICFVCTGSRVSPAYVYFTV